MGHGREHVWPSLPAEVPVEIEFVAGSQLFAIAGPMNQQARKGFLLHADLYGALVVGEDLLQVRRPVATALVDAVEPLSVLAGPVVNLEARILRELELVGGLSHGQRLLNGLLRLEVLVRQLEAVVPEGVFARPKLLDLLPVVDTVVVALAPFGLFVGDLRLPRNVRMALWRVRHDHLVRAVGVLEVVVDALLFHEAAREVEIGLAVLHAEVARLERSLQLVTDVEPYQHLLQDVGD